MTYEPKSYKDICGTAFKIGYPNHKRMILKIHKNDAKLCTTNFQIKTLTYVYYELQNTNANQATQFSNISFHKKIEIINRLKTFSKISEPIFRYGPQNKAS